MTPDELQRLPECECFLESPLIHLWSFSGAVRYCATECLYSGVCEQPLHVKACDAVRWLPLRRAPHS